MLTSVYKCLAVLCVFCTASANAAAEETAALFARCAPKVDAETLGAIVRTESSGHLFVISDDGPSHLPWSARKKMLRSFHPASMQEAAAIATALIQAGHLVGLGLTQISSQHLARLGLTVEEVLEPCRNLTVGSELLMDAYLRALSSGRYATKQAALGAALSANNTGNFSRGFKNGYVAKVVGNLGAGVPTLHASPKRFPSLGHLTLAHKPSSRGSRAAHVSSFNAARLASLDVPWE